MQTYQEHLPVGVTSRTIPVDDLDMHILEAGDPASPLILLLHGFPELAISWRKVMVPIAEMGYRVVAPDQRGFGLTVSRGGRQGQVRFEDDVNPYRVINIVRDSVALVYALGYRTAAAVVGHDAGSGIAVYCALIRPDIFRSMVILSTPFPGPPALPFAINPESPPKPEFNLFAPELKNVLAALDPPRKYYIPYFASPEANDDMTGAPQGLHAFLRAYYHMKSGDWPGNDPHPLSSFVPSEVAKLPHYYMMPLAATMPEAVAPHAPSAEDVRRNNWLTDAELAVYVAEYARTGFQGGLNWYRALQPRFRQELAAFSGRKIEVPAMFVFGEKDWGVFQSPGALEKMKTEACSSMDDENVVSIAGAGHWLQQEQPEEVVHHIGRFLRKLQASG